MCVDLYNDFLSEGGKLFPWVKDIAAENNMLEVFVCGPTPMVEAVAEALVGLGHEPGRVKTERFGATGGG